MLRRRMKYTYTDDDSPEFDFSIEPLEGTIETRHLDDGRWVVGYLAMDSDPPNPQDDWDGQGKVRSLSRRHINNIDCDEAVEVLKTDKMAVPLSYYEHGDRLWMVQGEYVPGVEFQWDGTRFAGVWIPDDCARDNILCQAQGLRLHGVTVSYESQHTPEGKCITRPAKPGETAYFADGTCIDERYSNVITITYPDGTKKGGYKSFTSAYQAAARKLGIKLTGLDDAIRKAAYEYAKGCVDTYSQWANGECYGWVVVTFDEDGEELDSDSCWGIYGRDYAESERDDNMKYAAEKAAE